MSHYFLNDETLKTKEQFHTVTIGSTEVSFWTDYGVFSKKGLDYGTRVLLQSLPISNMSGSVLDFGCGYGPIGIYVAKNTDCVVDMIDINERSVALANKNSLENHISARVFVSDQYTNIDQTYDYIISNPPIRVGKKILYQILFSAKDYLNENGQLWIVVHKDQGAKSLVKDLECEYDVAIKSKSGGFFVICATKRLTS